MAGLLAVRVPPAERAVTRSAAQLLGDLRAAGLVRSATELTSARRPPAPPRPAPPDADDSTAADLTDTADPADAADFADAADLADAADSDPADSAADPPDHPAEPGAGAGAVPLRWEPHFPPPPDPAHRPAAAATPSTDSRSAVRLASSQVAGSARLAELRAAGLVRSAAEPDGGRIDPLLPVAAALRPLLPSGGLRRGTTVAVAPPVPGRRPASARPAAADRRPAVDRAALMDRAATATSTAGSSGESVSATEAVPRADASSVAGAPSTTTFAAAAGATSLLLALLAEASAAGSWCAVVGLPQLGLVAAAEAGLAIERLGLVPYPGADWSAVCAALLDGVDIVVTAAPGPVSAQTASRLTARARQRGAVLVPVGSWPGADLTLDVVAGVWHGLDQGRGRLRRYEAEVRAYGRGAATRPRHARLWLSGPTPVVAVDQAGPVRPAAAVAREDTATARAAAVRTDPAHPGLAGASDVPLPLAG